MSYLNPNAENKEQNQKKMVTRQGYPQENVTKELKKTSFLICNF